MSDKFVPYTHKLADMLASGLVEMNLPAQSQMPGIGFLTRHRAHCAIRLTDGLWHCFRYSDVEKAKEVDTNATGGILSKK